MSSSDQNSTIATLLNSLEEALDEGNPSDVLAFLRVLRMNGVDDQASADLVATFSDSPDPDDFDRTRDWIAGHRQRINPTSDDPPPSDSDSLIDVEIDDELSDFGDFGDFDEMSAVDEVDEIDPFDDFDDFADFDDIGDFGDLSMDDGGDADDFFQDDLDAPGDQVGGPDEEPNQGDISQTPFVSGHTPAPSPTTGQMPASTATDDEVSTAITGEREMTRQLGADHLQALSEASGASSGDATSVFDHPTRREFQASPPSSSDTAKAPPKGDVPPPTREAFNFDYDSPGGDTPDASSDGAHFDAGEVPPPLIEGEPSSPDDSDDLDFDFDLGPTSAPSSSEEAFDQPPATNPGDVDGSMAYAPPPSADDSFFPPPLSEDDSSSSVESTTPAPFPESPSVSDSLPHSENTPKETAEATQQSPRRDTQKTPLASESQIQDTGAATPSDDLQQESSPLSEDELLALGEELSSGEFPPPEKSNTLPGSPSRTPSQPGSYRGEPMIPDNSSPQSLGNEPTPAHNSPSPLNAPDFSQPDEPTNKFNREDPDVGEAYKTPAGPERSSAQPLTESSSFYLEEVQDSPQSSTASNASSQEQSSGDDVTIDDAINRARALYEQGEFQTAMELVEAILELEDHPSATELQRLLEGELERMQANRLGSLALTPSLEISMGEMAQLDLDHRAGFLLSQIDGMLTFEDILDMSSMSRLETLTVLADLYEEDIIAVD